VGFPLAAWQRRQGQVESAIKFWKSQIGAGADPAYRTWARSEIELSQASERLSRPTWDCPKITQAPRLDGQLNDAAWSQVNPERLQSQMDVHEPLLATVWLAHDDQYLYLAARCPNMSSQQQFNSDLPRQRDQPRPGDRLEIYLDVDRDMFTHWQLSVDERGWASERLNHDPTWNPTWYIANATDEQQWTIEAAMPLAELTNEPITPGSAWCIGLQRIIPSQDWQTWMQTAPVEARPQEFGLLLFR
jgi:hypothetical protein